MLRAFNVNQLHRRAAQLLYRYRSLAVRSYNLDYYSVTQDDTSLLSVTINFDPHVMQVCAPLRCVATSCFTVAMVDDPPVDACQQMLPLNTQPHDAPTNKAQPVKPACSCSLA